MDGREEWGWLRTSSKKTKKRNPPCGSESLTAPNPPLMHLLAIETSCVISLICFGKYMDDLEEPELNVFTSAPAKEKKIDYRGVSQFSMKYAKLRIKFQ